MQDIWEADFRDTAGSETDNFSNLWLCVAIVYQITYHLFLLYKKKKKEITGFWDLDRWCIWWWSKKGLAVISQNKWTGHTERKTKPNLFDSSLFIVLAVIYHIVCLCFGD